MEKQSAITLLRQAEKCRTLAQGQDQKTYDALIQLAVEYEARAAAVGESGEPAPDEPDT